MHIFDPRFAHSPHWKRTPPDAPVAVYRRLQQRIGTERTVVVTPSTYGTDNACTLDSLARLGTAACGVAVIDPDGAKATVAMLKGHAIRGLRVNFVTPQPWGVTTPAMLESVARIAADAGWHVQVFARGSQLLAMEASLRGLPCPVVIDHLGCIESIGQDAFAQMDLMRRLLDTGRCWVKLSGVYMSSREGAPRYGDMASLGRTLLRHAPTRLVWGSDWPHTTEPATTVNDADLLDVLADWCSDDAAAWNAVLVSNPAALYGFEEASPPA